MRHGMLNTDDVHCLQSLSRPLHYSDGIEPSQLFPLRREVESCNNSRLKELPGPKHNYPAMDHAGYDIYGNPIERESAELLLDRINALSIISLKAGAQVMLIQNVEQGSLVNGSQGLVLDFITTHDAQERGIAIAEQTTRRGQDDIPISDGSTVSSEDLRPLNNNVFGRQQLWPLVRFENGREMLCPPLDFTVEGFMGNVEARRTTSQG
ncbi:hypothetical protein CPB84DRAFT_490815 [Gymnopilus junonius]|uniref:DNA helicase Pif1-like 2B domain-containing protein n=1 Tax=Gymnopilus junonius TaxID=109634 RepID=A0A9P5TTA0_GYMJU|nr:hypothetical protein CPB84DRAFT_490815 [Gymnopilus junonius]